MSQEPRALPAGDETQQRLAPRSRNPFLPARSRRRRSGAERAGRTRRRHPGSARACGRCPAGGAVAACAAPALRCEEPPRVRHIGARAAAAVRCSSISCRRSRPEPSAEGREGGREGNAGAAGREAGRGGDGNERGPRPPAPAPCATRHGEEAGRPLSEERTHARTETCPRPARSGPAAISGEKPPGSRLRRDMEAVKAFNSEVCNPAGGLPSSGPGSGRGPRARRLPCPPCSREAAGTGGAPGGPGTRGCCRRPVRRSPPRRAGKGRCRRPWEAGGWRG